VCSAWFLKPSNDCRDNSYPPLNVLTLLAVTCLPFTVGGYAGKYLGYEEGKDKGINEGTRVVLVERHSERKLYWKWSSTVPDLPGAAKKPRGPA